MGNSGEKMKRIFFFELKERGNDLMMTNLQFRNWYKMTNFIEFPGQMSWKVIELTVDWLSDGSAIPFPVFQLHTTTSFPLHWHALPILRLLNLLFINFLFLLFWYTQHKKKKKWKREMIEAYEIKITWMVQIKRFSFFR